MCRPGRDHLPFMRWLALLACLCSASSLHAETVTWDGGGTTNNWSDGANWDTGVAPTADDYLVFAGSTRTTPSINDLDADTSFARITFNPGASTFTLSGNRIILTGGI